MTTVFRRSCPVDEQHWRSCEAWTRCQYQQIVSWLPRVPLGLDWSCVCKNSMATSMNTAPCIDPRDCLPLELPEGIRADFLQMFIHSRCIEVIVSLSDAQ